MRRTLWIAMFLAATSWASPGRGQSAALTGNLNDPFFLYYGYFLPRQAALANQPDVNDTINAQVVARQAYAQTNRAALYDPNGGYGQFDTYAQLDPYEDRGGAVRSGGRLRSRTFPSGNINGRGPGLYFNRAAQYFPGLRTGIGPNRNLAVAGRGVRGGRGSGMASPSMGPR